MSCADGRGTRANPASIPRGFRSGAWERRARGPARSVPSRFLGVDLAWSRDIPSRVVALAGRTFPLWLPGDAGVLPTHAAVLAWSAAEVEGWPAAVGVDAPLLGLGGPPRRRPCDDLVAPAFGRFHASGAQLAENGVKRIRAGGSLSRAALARRSSTLRAR